MDKVSLLRDVPLFQDLSDEHLRRVADVAYLRSYPKGAAIFRERESGQCMFLVISGSIRLTLTSKDGREFTLSILRAKDCFGEMSIIDGRGRSATATAHEDSQLLMLYQQDFLRLLSKYPPIALRLLQVLTTRLRHSDELIRELVFLDAKARLARLLLEWASESGVKTPEGFLIPKVVTHEQIGGMIGASRETTTRALSSFRDKKWARMTKKGILLLNQTALQNVAELR